MKEMFASLLKLTPLYYPLRNWCFKKMQPALVWAWERNGRPSPPPHMIKQKVLKAYAKTFHLKVFVETGTYYGDMVDAMKDSFDKIYSIELSHRLFEKAKKRFESLKHVEIIHGDSGKELGNVMKKIRQPALFWLDGHYSAGETVRGEKDTPIYEELSRILNSQETCHVIVIDDARCFGTDPAYPSLDKLMEFFCSKRNHLQITVQDDSIQITPKS